MKSNAMHDTQHTLFLKTHKLQLGSLVTLTLHNGKQWSGRIMSPCEYTQAHLALQLEEGFFIGVHLSEIESIQEEGFHPPLSDEHNQRTQSKQRKDTLSKWINVVLKDQVVVLYADSIASQWKNKWLSKATHLFTEQTFHYVFGQAVTNEEAHTTWKRLSQTLVQLMHKEPKGFVVCLDIEHLRETALALSWMIQNQPIPILFYGLSHLDKSNQRHYNRLQQAISAVRTLDIAETLIYTPENQENALSLQAKSMCLLATRAERTNQLCWHSVATSPIALSEKAEWKLLTASVTPRFSFRTPLLQTTFEPNVALIWPQYGQMLPTLKRNIAAGAKGAIIGCWHGGKLPISLKKEIRDIAESSFPLFAVSQLRGIPCSLHSTKEGRQLLSWGVQELRGMLPEVALSKLGWVLGQTTEIEQVKTLMQQEIAGEFYK